MNTTVSLPRPAVPFLAINDLSVAFDGSPAVRSVSLQLGRGETLGLVGESGSGKSVTFLAMLGLLPSYAAVTGSARLEGVELVGASRRVLEDVRGKRVAMIFQDPASALNPVLTIRKQLCESLMLHRGLTQSAAKAEARRLLELVGIPDPGRRLDAYPHEFSGGQNQRIMIAIALAGRPDLLIADEPTTALDVTIQAQILDLLALVRKETGLAMVLISHDLGVIFEQCDRVAVMYAGRLVEEASAASLYSLPAHPYTRGLLGALPRLTGARTRLTAIAGTVPTPETMPKGCAFGPRCESFLPSCDEAVPQLRALSPLHRVACPLDFAVEQNLDMAAE